MIKRTSLERLRTMEFFHINSRIDTLLQKEDLTALRLEEAYEKHYQPAFAAFDEATKPARKTGLTQPLLEADSRRDEATVALNAYLRAMTLSPDSDKREAAKRISLIVEKYGKGIQSLGLKEQTAVTTNLLQELNAATTKNDVEAIAAAPWVELIATANKEVETIMADRTAMEAVVETGKTRTTRDELQRALSALCERINALALIDGEAPYKNLIDNINQIVDEAIGTQKQRSSAKKKETDNSEDTI